MIFANETTIWLEALILTLAALWDVVLGEPARFHPVRGLGKLIEALEKMAPKRGKVAQFLFGAALAVILPLALAIGTYFLVINLRQTSAIAYIVVAVFLLKSTFAVKALAQEGLRICRRIEQAELPEARYELRSLVSRNTESLSRPLLASAAIESVGENVTDSFIAPWLAFVFFGLPGAVAYRTINTLDSMIGYHGKYEYLGKVSARLDDLLNIIPSRIAALLLIGASRVCRLNARRALSTMWREHGKTESPNAGWTMSAMSGALGVRLEKVGHYTLGAGFASPETIHIEKTVVVMWYTAFFSLFLALAIMGVFYAATT
ncbi:MAG: cobalamin biosynthesis protein CobD [Chloroflexi bacterium]|nr:cobalamin biosynthesis protein CobD [Chloroflexota bacterium]